MNENEKKELWEAGRRPNRKFFCRDCNANLTLNTKTPLPTPKGSGGPVYEVTCKCGRRNCCKRDELTLEHPESNMKM